MKQRKQLKRFLCSIIFGILSVAACFSIPAYACTTAYYSWTWDDSIDMSNLTVQVYSSDFHETVTVNALYAWNMITPIYVRYVNYSSDITSGNIEDINVHEQDFTGTTVGQTRLYRKNFLGMYVESSISSTNTDVCQARIYLDPSLLDSSDEQRARTVTHEMGHAFGMMHPVLNDCETRCIMQQGGSGFGTNTIQQHDENNMIAKWGAYE